MRTIASIEAHSVRRSIRRPPWPAALCYLAAASLLAFGYFSNESTCFWHAITGLPCPGCGTLHAFIALARGDVRAAWRFNPTSFVTAPILLSVAIRKTKELII